MAAALGQDRLLARVAKFDYCYDDQCTFSEDLHLQVEMQEVELHRGNATAISYTWGDFDRERVQLGHMADAGHTPVSMELGKEWVIPDLINRLAELGIEEGPCWIDQLCIPQSDQEVRLALASVPLIYRSFNVVALLPGRPCKCLSTAIRLCNRIEEAKTLRDHDATREAMSSFWAHKGRMNCCANSLSPSSWFKRVWTRQELMYSRRVRALWSSHMEAECIELSHVRDQASELSQSAWGQLPTDSSTFTRAGFDPDTLTPYARALWANHLPEQLRLSHGQGPTMPRRDLQRILIFLTEIALVSVHFEHAGRNDFAEYTQTSGTFAYTMFYRFLAGEVIESKLAEPGSQDEWTNLRRFLGTLGRLPGQSFRAATHPQDYVTSLWVDCPRYRLPDTYRSMSLPTLVQDALNQLHTNFGILPVSIAPNGLFHDSEGSGLWVPSDYLRNVDLTDLSQVYGPLSSPELGYIPIGRNGIVSLRLLGPGARAISARAIDVSVTMDRASLGAVISSMKLVTARWPPHIKKRLNSYIANPEVLSTAPDLWPRILDVCTALLTPVDEGTPVDLIRTLSSPEHPERPLVLYNIIYDMVAQILGLDPRICRACNLRLAIRPTRRNPNNNVIGFLRKNIGLDTIWMADEPRDDNSMLTVCMQRFDHYDGSMLFEAERIATADTRPFYRVFGIWVPTMGTSFHDVGAVTHDGDADAFLV